MKKILVVLLALGSITTVFAQHGQRNESRDVILGQGNNKTIYNNRYDNYSMTARERDREILRIQREYDQRINAVKWNRYLRNAEKRRQIRSLEAQRDQEIRWLNERFYSYNRNNSYGRNDRRY